MGAVCPITPADPDSTFPEEYDREGLRKYIDGNPNREHNNRVRLDMYQDIASRPAVAGRVSEEVKMERDDAKSCFLKLQGQEQKARELLSKLDAEANRSQMAHPDSPPPLFLRMPVSYRTKYANRSRRMVDGVGLAPLKKTLQVMVSPDLHEWDIKSCSMTLLLQLVSRVKPILDHPIAAFLNLRKYTTDRAQVHDEIGLPSSSAKQLVMGVLNGMKIPEHLKENVFLQSLKQEGRLLRWIACTLQPAFHTTALSDDAKSWPEATTLFYTWSPVEDHVLEALCDYGLSLGPGHLSLHYDAIKISPASYGYL
jgi:hypothetical protein